MGLKNIACERSASQSEVLLEWFLASVRRRRAAIVENPQPTVSRTCGTDFRDTVEDMID